MALIVCPECEQQMSDTATACPRCGWARAALEAQEREASTRAATYGEGERLLKQSNQLVTAGAATLVGAAIIGAMAGTVVLLGGLAVGFGVCIFAAMMGSKGRALQNNVMRAQTGDSRGGGGVRAFVLGAILGGMLGAAASQFTPFLGTSGIGGIAQPFSPWRLNFLWQHVGAGAVGLGLLAMVLSRASAK